MIAKSFYCEYIKNTEEIAKYKKDWRCERRYADGETASSSHINSSPEYTLSLAPEGLKILSEKYCLQQNENVTLTLPFPIHYAQIRILY